MDTLRPRTIATNDGECDDMNTFLHTLLYANDLDIEGLVYSSSVHHYAGDPARDLAPKRWEEPAWMYRYLDAYAEVYDHLRAHDRRYPTPAYLRSITCVGNIRFPGDMEFDTPGSDLIYHAILKDDPRPVYLLAGGGTNTIARALKRIELEYRDTDAWDNVYQHVCSHAVVLAILLQDDTIRDYLSWTWPDLRVLVTDSNNCIGFTYNATNSPAEALATFDGPWMERNIISKGTLGALYHTWLDGHYYEGDTAPNQFGTSEQIAREGNVWLPGGHTKHQMISEGDSPAFLYLINKGLRQLEDPGYGSWGGRFVPLKQAMGEQTLSSWIVDLAEHGNPAADIWVYGCDENDLGLNPKEYQLSRWICDGMNDFALRLSWAAGTDEELPEAPRIHLVDSLDRTVSAGATVTLEVACDDVAANVTYDWFLYPEAGTCSAPASLTAQGSRATVTIPAEARAGETVHVVVRARVAPATPAATEPYAVSYQRAILTIGDAAASEA